MECVWSTIVLNCKKNIMKTGGAARSSSYGAPMIGVQPLRRIYSGLGFVTQMSKKLIRFINHVTGALLQVMMMIRNILKVKLEGEEASLQFSFEFSNLLDYAHVVVRRQKTRT